MKRIFQTPETALPLALSLLVLAGTAGIATLLPESVAHEGSSGWVLVTLIVVGAAMGLYRPRHGLSLGATVLAPMSYFFGPIVGGLLAGVLRALQLLGRPTVERSRGRRRARLLSGPFFVGTLGAAVAGLAAAGVWYLVALPLMPRGSLVLLAVAVGAGALQVAAFAGLEWTAGWVGISAARRGSWLDPVRLLDIAGWALGAVLVAVYAYADTTTGTVAALAAAVLVAELTRNEIKLARRDRQIETLSEMSAIGHRVTAPRGELTRVAEQLLVECRKVVPAQWTQLEIVARDSETRTWRSGPDGAVEEGVPRPPDKPPPIPGVHRRAAWQILDKDLVAGERIIGTLRLWTDPRQTDWEQLELLDTLLPQLATSLAAVLADQKASRDSLTKLATRPVLEERLEQAYRECVAEGASMSVVMCDIDHFKKVNDEHGHATGDHALQEVAAVLERHSRGRDTVCRYGGEEFTILMEGAGGEAAVAAAERLRKAAQEIRIDSGEKTLMLTVSLGVACFPETYVSSGADLVPLADAALYEAKRRGRNRTILALGEGRFQNTRGQRLKGDSKSEQIEAPRLFV